MTQAIMLGTISLNNMAGGLEKNIIILANHLANKGHRVVLVSLDLEKAKPFFEIDERVAWIRAGVSKPHAPVTFTERLNVIRNIRLAMVQHDIHKVVVFTHGLLARFLIAGLGLKISFICSERNALAMYNFIRQRKWNLNFLLLALVKKITVQFDDYKNDYPFWLKHKIVTIHNPVFPPSRFSDLSQKRILMVGRLAVQKRFDVAIQAFAIVLKYHPDWRLHIVGDGPLHSKLNNLARKLGVHESVSILPPTKSIELHYRECSIFLTTSQWEGFPNALAEAMSCGLIAIGSEETSGVPKLITSGKTGELIHGKISIAGVARTLLNIIERENSWREMADTSRKISKEYSVESWIKLWRQALE